LLALLAWLIPAPAPGATVIWCEAELFDDLGGWLRDAQFVDQMGSPFLLAYGLEGPVKDAVTTVEVPAAGQYRLWVRARDWLPEFSPGRFQVLLDGKPREHVFGQSKAKGWIWEDGGTQALAAGRLKVQLHDLSGHYGRCDALVLTDDAGYRPPDDLKALDAQRIAHGGVSREVKKLEPFDTVVVGGGLAGTFAAVASARMGCKTVLIQNRPVLGGNGSSEVLVNPEGDTTREPLDPAEGGIIEEVRGPVAGYSDRMLKLCEHQPNLTLLLNTHATGVELRAPGAIAAVTALCVTTKQRLLIPGTTFIDCTGDGEIGFWAGAEWRHGREPRSMYHESRAPVEADGHTMGGTLRYATEKTTAPVEFHAPPWARKFEKCSDFTKGRHPQLSFGGWQWVLEYGGMSNTFTDAEEIRDELLRILWGAWDHLKNHCPKVAAEADKYKLTWVSYVVGKRESRRIIGDHVLIESEIAKKELFPDRVSYAGWGIDIHPPGGFYDTAPPATFSHKVKFSIPFRCLYSKDVCNLMMAGRCISVSHVALGATRVMITCGLQGQAVGTAAGFCKLHQADPRTVGQRYIADLQQQLLKDGCYLIDLPNQDPRDLARAAKASASSVSPPVVIAMPSQNTTHPLTCQRGVVFPVTAPRINTVSLYLESNNRAATTIELDLRSAKDAETFETTEHLASASATVPPRSAGWVKFTLNLDVKPGLYWICLPKAAGLSWALYDTAPPNTARGYRFGKDEWHSDESCYRFRLDPPSTEAAAAAAVKDIPPVPTKPPAAMFAAENVVEGYARAIRGTPHSWRPDPKQPLPQWVQLDFGKPVTFNCVHVAFQSKVMRADDFRIEAANVDDWSAVADVTENFDRRAVLKFKRITASKLRLVLTKVRPDVGVCQIRVYDEPAAE
jgi:hypothetical protein